MILSEAAEELRALIIEDDPTVAEIYRYKLELDGYRVSVAAGNEALAGALELAPDLIFLNVLLPSLDAASVLDQLRADERTRHVPVVVLTDHDLVELRRHGFELDGGDHVIDTSTLTADSTTGRGWAGVAVVPGEQAPENSAMPAFLGTEAFGG